MMRFIKYVLRHAKGGDATENSGLVDANLIEMLVPCLGFPLTDCLCGRVVGVLARLGGFAGSPEPLRFARCG